MGCDIHPYIEINEDFKEPRFAWWRLRSIMHMSRDYNVFGILAGVRSGWKNPISEPKGLPVPEGENYEKLYGEFYEVYRKAKYDDDAAEVRLAQQNFAEALEGSMDYDLLKIFLHGHMDYHTPSWLTLAELKSYDWDQEVEVEQMYVLTNKESENSRKKALAAVKDLDEKDPEYANKFDAAFGEWRKQMNELVKVPLRKFIKNGVREDKSIFAVMTEMERVKPKGGTDNDVRLVFWFDN